MYEGQTDPEMAPSDLSWHAEYERWLQGTQKQLDSLQKHPSFSDAEDLGDYVETISTLLSFAPRTRDDIRIAVKEELDGLRQG